MKISLGTASFNALYNTANLTYQQTGVCWYVGVLIFDVLVSSLIRSNG